MVELTRGSFAAIRVNNGPDFVSKTLNRWVYQNGITRPSTRAPSLRAARPAAPGSRSKIGLTNTATANSTPTISPTATTVTTASTSIGHLLLALLGTRPTLAHRCSDF